MKWMGLLAVFAIVLAVRLFFSFSTPFLTSDEAYFEYRVVEHVLDAGLPLQFDALSWGGSAVIVSPVFSYILALFGLFLPLHFVMKVVPNIFASLLVVPVFLIVRSFVKQEWVALTAAFVASFVPIFFAHTFNQASSAALAVPVFFMLIYCWLHISEKVFLYSFIGLLVFFAFFHPICLAFVLGLAVYVIFCAAEKIKLANADLELLLFSLGLSLWAQFLLYKKAVVFHGLSVFWLNLPSRFLSFSFHKLNILDVLLQVGFFPLCAGSYVLYRNVFKSKRKDILLFFSMSFVLFLLLWLKFINIFLGLSLLGVLLVILAAEGLSMFRGFLSETKVAKYSRLISVSLVVVVIASMLVPAAFSARTELKSTISESAVESLLWLRDNSVENAVVLAPAEWGNYVAAIAQRPNVIDKNFLLHADSEERLDDVDRTYVSMLQTEVVDILDKYDVDYVFVPEGYENVEFEDAECFRHLFGETNLVYSKLSRCRLRVVS